MREKLSWVACFQLGLDDVGFAKAALVGVMNGVNRTFLLQPGPRNGVMIFREGVLQNEGPEAVGQYTRSGAYITFSPQSIPVSTEKLSVFVW